MPSPEENKIQDAFKKKNHDEIIQVITETPRLVNMISTKNKFSFSLMFMLIHFERDLDIIQFIVTHPDFDFQFTNKFVDNHSYTNIEEIFLYGRKDVLATIIDKPEILMTNNELTYARAKLILESEKSTLALTLKANEKDAERINEIAQMLSMIREATIKRAIATDNPTLLDQLEKAGDNLRDDLSNGICPNQSLKKSNTKLQEWFLKYFVRHPINREAADQSAHRFFENNKQVDKDLGEITRRHYESLANVNKNANERRSERMTKVNDILKKM